MQILLGYWIVFFPSKLRTCLFSFPIFQVFGSEWGYYCVIWRVDNQHLNRKLVGRWNFSSLQFHFKPNKPIHRQTWSWHSGRISKKNFFSILTCSHYKDLETLNKIGSVTSILRRMSVYILRLSDK